MKGFLYTGKLSEESLKKLINEFFQDEESFYVLQAVDRFEIKGGLPTEFTPKGQAFSRKGEVKWVRKKESYSILLLAGNSVEKLPPELKMEEGDWIFEEQEFDLVNPLSANVNPSFQEYPNKAKFITTQVCLKNGVPLFVSPRGFKK